MVHLQNHHSPVATIRVCHAIALERCCGQPGLHPVWQCFCGMGWSLGDSWLRGVTAGEREPSWERINGWLETSNGLVQPRYSRMKLQITWSLINFRSSEFSMYPFPMKVFWIVSMHIHSIHISLYKYLDTYEHMCIYACRKMHKHIRIYVQLHTAICTLTQGCTLACIS